MTEPLKLHVIQGGRTDQPQPAEPEPLWREVLGDQLRELRRQHHESLAETAARAGISPQYLSEVERGLKEPSSEMIAAVAGALGTTLGGLAEAVAGELRVQREAASLAARREFATRQRAGGPVMLALAA
jgi:transcriptional regulator with XRE-family HTH domain